MTPRSSAKTVWIALAALLRLAAGRGSWLAGAGYEALELSTSLHWGVGR